MGRWKKGEALLYNDAGEIQGVVYCYKNKNPEAGEEYNCAYVGYTDKELRRKGNWNAKGRYSGRKINEAREKWGIKNFTYEVLAYVYDKDRDNLRKKMREVESIKIRELDAVEHGYNGNYGGGGKTGTHCSEETKEKMRNSMPTKVSVIIIAPSGEETLYQSINAAARALNLNCGNIHYHLFTSKSNTLATGHKVKLAS